MRNNTEIKRKTYHEIISNCRFKELVEYLSGAAFNILHNQEYVDDVVQIAFEKAERKISTFNREMTYDAIKRWLSAITVNAARDFLRENMRMEVSSLYPEYYDLIFERRLRRRIPEKKSDLDYLIEEEEQERLKKDIMRLPDNLRNTAILLLSGSRYRQIAKIEKIPLGTVKSRRDSAINHLRDAINYSQK